MNKILTIFLLGLFISNCCNQDNLNEDGNYNICGVENPKWFLNLLDDVEDNKQYYFGSSISRYSYNSDYYFEFEIPVSSYYPHTYDCEGNLVEWSDQEDVQKYIDNRTDKTPIWYWEE